MIFVGIDPGAQGGIALLDNKGKIMNLIPYSDKALLEMLDNMKLPRTYKIWLEDVTRAMITPQHHNAKGLINQAMNFGYIQGALHMAGHDFNLVTPQEWRKEHGLLAKGRTHKENKVASVDLATARWPHCDFKRTGRSRTPSDGLCEAALIAEYGRRMAIREQPGGEKG
jgi:hypothetical protein